MNTLRILIILCLFLTNCKSPILRHSENREIKIKEIQIASYNDYYNLDEISIKPIFGSYIDSLGVLHCHGCFNFSLNYSLQLLNNKIPSTSRLQLSEIQIVQPINHHFYNQEYWNEFISSDTIYIIPKLKQIESKNSKGPEEVKGHINFSCNTSTRKSNLTIVFQGKYLNYKTNWHK